MFMLPTSFCKTTDLPAFEWTFDKSGRGLVNDQLGEKSGQVGC